MHPTPGLRRARPPDRTVRYLQHRGHLPAALHGAGANGRTRVDKVASPPSGRPRSSDGLASSQPRGGRPRRPDPPRPGEQRSGERRRSEEQGEVDPLGRPEPAGVAAADDDRGPRGVREAEVGTSRGCSRRSAARNATVRITTALHDCSRERPRSRVRPPNGRATAQVPAPQFRTRPCPAPLTGMAGGTSQPDLTSRTITFRAITLQSSARGARLRRHVR